MNDGENGVTISFKEIYDELLKMRTQMNGIGARVDGIERQLQEDSKRRTEFSQKVKIALITAGIPVALAIIWFVAKEGGL